LLDAALRSGHLALIVDMVETQGVSLTSDDVVTMLRALECCSNAVRETQATFLQRSFHVLLPHKHIEAVGGAVIARVLARFNVQSLMVQFNVATLQEGTRVALTRLGIERASTQAEFEAMEQLRKAWRAPIVCDFVRTNLQYALEYCNTKAFLKSTRINWTTLTREHKQQRPLVCLPLAVPDNTLVDIVRAVDAITQSKLAVDFDVNRVLGWPCDWATYLVTGQDLVPATVDPDNVLGQFLGPYRQHLEDAFVARRPKRSV
jgi:hypothetical protein